MERDLAHPDDLRSYLGSSGRRAFRLREAGGEGTGTFGEAARLGSRPRTADFREGVGLLRSTENSEGSGSGEQGHTVE